MKCIYCGAELQEGKTLFTSQGVASMSLMSFTSQEEAKKSFFKRKTKDVMILSGDECQAFYCDNCHKLMVIFDEKR